MPGKWRCKTMKKAIAVMILLMLMLMLTACGGSDTQEAIREDMAGFDTETNEMMPTNATNTYFE